MYQNIGGIEVEGARILVAKILEEEKEMLCHGQEWNGL